MRIINDSNNEIIAGYAYKLRKNSKGEKSIYIDGIARKISDNNSKKVMTDMYEDIKSTAKKHNAQEITLFSYATDRNLRHNYRRLGFKIDEKCIVEKLYLMRVRTKNFLNNTYFKLRKYKEALGVDSILRINNNNKKLPS